MCEWPCALLSSSYSTGKPVSRISNKEQSSCKAQIFPCSIFSSPPAKVLFLLPAHLRKRGRWWPDTRLWQHLTFGMPSSVVATLLYYKHQVKIFILSQTLNEGVLSLMFMIFFLSKIDCMFNILNYSMCMSFNDASLFLMA